MSRILVFKAAWCGPCKAMAPIIEEVTSSRNIEVIKFDADENPEEFDKWSVRNVPTIIFIDQEDNVIHRVSGAMNKREFEILVDNL